MENKYKVGQEVMILNNNMLIPVGTLGIIQQVFVYEDHVGYWVEGEDFSVEFLEESLMVATDLSKVIYGE